MHYEKDIFQLNTKQSAELRLQEAILNRQIGAITRKINAEFQKGRDTGEQFGPERPTDAQMDALHRGNEKKGPTTQDWAFFPAASGLRNVGLQSAGGLSVGHLGGSTGQAYGYVRHSAAAWRKEETIEAKKIAAQKGEDEARKSKEDVKGTHQRLDRQIAILNDIKEEWTG